MRIDSGQQAYRELIAKLREPPVRDLAWLLLSDDLLSAARFPAALAHLDAGNAATAALHDWLLACDADAAPLREFIVQQGESNRLGRYAEQLLHFALLNSPSLELLAAGLQVRDVRRGNMTLGECDFLLERRADRQLLHWELAVKLYLFVPPAGPIAQVPPLDERSLQFHWLGPNLADSLADKVARLLGHQLRLTTFEAVRSALPAAGPWLPQVYLKGWLFHPLTQPATLPQVAAETHGRGWWATLDEWWVQAQATLSVQGDASSSAGVGDEAWAILPRARWLAPARVGEHAVFSLAAMRERIETHWRERGVAEPLLVVSLTRPASAQGDWIERTRGFIVPDYWAPRARHRIEELAGRAEAAARRALAESANDGAPSL